MTKRIIIGGLVGAVIVFVVSAIWHLSSLGEIGVQRMPGEAAISAAMRDSIHEPGFFYFPAPADMKGMPKEQAAAAQAAYLAAYKQGPTGILVYSPGGVDLDFGKLLFHQFLFNVAAALLIAWVLALAAGSTTYGGRVLIVLLISVIAGLIYDLPYWNWYGFPMNYTIAHIGSWCLAWTVGGLGMAAIVKR